MSKRDIIKIRGRSFYAVRDRRGRFVDITSIGKSIGEDERIRAKKIAKPSHGHEGDLKK
jgi:hypothetical protein